MKRVVEEKKVNTENESYNNNKKFIKYYSKNYYNNNPGNINNNPESRKKCYALRNNDIESFQRKIFRDYNSNVACLPGVTINEKEKTKTLVATNSKKNESHISLGNTNNNENINYNSLRNKYDYTKKNMKGVPRPVSFSGKRIVRDRNKESNTSGRVVNNKINRTGYFYTNDMNYYDNDLSQINRKQQKYMTDKNKSQIIFG